MKINMFKVKNRWAYVRVFTCELCVFTYECWMSLEGLHSDEILSKNAVLIELKQMWSPLLDSLLNWD